MTAIGFVSAKHSPGVTTSLLAIGLAMAETTSTVAIEADPAGGDLGAICGLKLERGLLSTTAAMRNDATPDLSEHLHQHGDLNVLVAPTSPSQVANALGTSGLAAMTAARSAFDSVVIDLGRLDVAANLPPMATACDKLIIVARPTVASVEHVRARLPLITQHANVSLLVVGSHPYGPDEVAQALGLNLLGQLPISERDVELITHNPSSKNAVRCSLMRSARALVSDLTDESEIQMNHVGRLAS